MMRCFGTPRPTVWPSAEHHAGEADAEAVAYHHPHNVIAARAERHANPDLGRPARDAIRQRAVQPDRNEHGGAAAERLRQPRHHQTNVKRYRM